MQSQTMAVMLYFPRILFKATTLNPLPISRASKAWQMPLLFPPKIEATQERATVSRNVSPQPPADIGHSVAVEDNTCAASNGTLVVESDQRPEDTIPCDPVDAGALIAGPKEALAKAEEENDHLIPDEIAKVLLGGANAQHSSTFSTCPNPAAAMDNLEACELQENGQQPCEVGHDSSSHSSTNARLLQPCENYPEFSKGTFAKIQLKLANAQCDKTVRYIIYIHDIVRPFRETALSQSSWSQNTRLSRII
ncbi:hypothetical protein V6Z93_005134 [Aspergillus fumigatus]